MVGADVTDPFALVIASNSAAVDLAAPPQANSRGVALLVLGPPYEHVVVRVTAYATNGQQVGFAGGERRIRLDAAGQNFVTLGLPEGVDRQSESLRLRFHQPRRIPYALGCEPMATPT